MYIRTRTNNLTRKVIAYERKLIVEAMKKFNGRTSAAAKSFSMGRVALQYRLEYHGISVYDFRKKPKKKYASDKKYGTPVERLMYKRSLAMKAMRRQEREGEKGVDIRVRPEFWAQVVQEYTKQINALIQINLTKCQNGLNLMAT